MMSLATIRHLEDEAAARAAREKKIPYMPFDREEVRRYGKGLKIPFPNLGSHRPKGWKLVEEFMVDKTGMGADYEPALTLSQLRQKILDEMDDHDYGYAIISEGQFQVVMGSFEQTKSA